MACFVGVQDDVLLLYNWDNYDFESFWDSNVRTALFHWLYFDYIC